jgi:MFS family permease
MQNEKFKFGKLFVIGFGFFGVSVLWSLYNTYVPILLEQKFALDAAAIGFFMSLDNIAALFIQPPVGAWSDAFAPFWEGACHHSGGRHCRGSPLLQVPQANTLPLFVASRVTTILQWLSGAHLWSR